MEKRENALREAIIKNAEETERWEKYQQENETAIENLDRFSKHLTVDVMVPVGKKAFMSGQLVHTNEILVGHYQGYFSKCSAHKAKAICEHRIKLAQKQLEKLVTEAELWQNKLEKPYVAGVLPSGKERDIIEPYDEIVEKQWRMEHRKRVRQFKQEEKKERDFMFVKENATGNAEKTDDEIFSMLEEAELMEELEKELDNLEVGEVSDETIKKLMSGELKLPYKERIAHNTVQPKHSIDQNNKLQGVVKRSEINSTLPELYQTNNNFRPNPELMAAINNQNNSMENSESDTEQLPEVQIIKEQATFLSKEDQIGFYEYQIQIIQQKLRTIPLQNQDSLNEKIRLHQVLEELEELLETVEEILGEEILIREEQEQQEENNEVSADSQSAKPAKRRISFANEDQTLEFRKNETIKQMLSKRDVITLNEPILTTDGSEACTKDRAMILDKKVTILDRVEQNRKYVEENQSETDFDMVNKILDIASNRENTLHIYFKHSNQSAFNNDSYKSVDFNDKDISVPCTPSDLYMIYLENLYQQETKNAEPTTIFLNIFDGEAEVNTPILCESKREQSYVDPRTEFLKLEKESKSILRNKDAVKNEIRTKMNQKKQFNNNSKKKKEKGKSKENSDEYLTVYDKVVGDIVEKLPAEPDPLPNCKYIDSHTPKQRVSRFKQMRSSVHNN